VRRKNDRLQLIRERHRELILAPRERVEVEIFQDDWNDFDCFDDEDMVRKFMAPDDDEE